MKGWAVAVRRISGELAIATDKGQLCFWPDYYESSRPPRALMDVFNEASKYCARYSVVRVEYTEPHIIEDKS